MQTLSDSTGGCPGAATSLLVEIILLVLRLVLKSTKLKFSSVKPLPSRSVLSTVREEKGGSPEWRCIKPHFVDC